MTSVHQLHLGHVILPDTHPRAADRTSQIYSYVIDHPDGLVVIDAGITVVEDMHDASWHRTGLDSLARLHSLAPARAHFSHDATTHDRS